MNLEIYKVEKILDQIDFLDVQVMTLISLLPNFITITLISI